MATKVNVRRQIRNELGLEKAKEFDRLYSVIKKERGHDIVLEDPDPTQKKIASWGRGFVRLETHDLNALLVIMEKISRKPPNILLDDFV